MVMLDEGQREDADAYVASRGKLSGQCRGGGSRGDHIIDDEHVTVTDCVGIYELKDIFDVFKALFCGQLGLTLGKRFATRYVSENRYACNLADALREKFTLVVAPLSQS